MSAESELFHNFFLNIAPWKQKIYDLLSDAPGILDPRMKGFLMNSPIGVIAVLAAYCIIISLGPSLMKKREAFDLRRILIIYNILQIFFNLVLFLMSASAFNQFSIFCSPSLKSDNALTQYFLQLYYLYIMLKFYDLLETFLFILRKKNQQISLLHVSHHVGILLTSWISGKYLPASQFYFIILYNSFVHMVMYVYYLATSYKRNFNVWWKKYITILQMFQFCVVFLSLLPAVVNVNCSFPRLPFIVLLIEDVVMITLFAKFYKKAYLSKTKCV